MTQESIEIEYVPSVMPPGQARGRKKERVQRSDSVVTTHMSSGRFPIILQSVTSFLTPDECRAFVKYGELEGFKLTRQTASRDFAHRKQGRISIQSQTIADSIFKRCLPFLPSIIDNAHPVGCSSNIRLYRYELGDSFGRHVDESSMEGGKMSKLTALIYLNQEEMAIMGGETVFYEAEDESRVFASFDPAELPGGLLLHGHGSRCLTHEASLVTEGTKYVLRTDVLYN